MKPANEGALVSRPVKKAVENVQAIRLKCGIAFGHQFSRWRRPTLGPSLSGPYRLLASLAPIPDRLGTEGVDDPTFLDRAGMALTDDGVQLTPQRLQ